MIDTALGGLGLAVATVAYNRDAYANNASMNQNQMYQEKNYIIAFITAVREEVRDVLDVFVGRMSSHVLVGTLLLGYVVVMLLEGPDFMQNGDSPRVLLQLFSVSTCLTLVSIMCCILCALKGMAQSYEQARKFLAEFTPEAPDEYNFNYLEQCTLGFEQSGEVWRVPLTDYPWWCFPTPTTSRWPRRKPLKEWKCTLKSPEVPEQRHVRAREELPRKRWHREKDTNSAEAGKLSEEGKKEGEKEYWNEYFKHISKLTEFWEPHKELTRILLAHSVVETTQALAYFSLGRYHNMGLHFSTVLCLMLTSLGAITAVQFRKWFNLCDKNMLFGPSMFLVMVLLTAAGPVSCALMIPLLRPHLQVILGMLCSLFSVFRQICLISLVPMKTHEDESKVQGQGPERTEHRSKVLERKEARPMGDNPEDRGNFEDHLKIVVDRLEHANALEVEHLGPEQRKAIRYFDGFGCFWWGVSFVLFALGLHETLQGRQRGHVGAAVVIDQLDVTWPSSRFLPHTLGCDGGHVFIADEFNIYELVASPERPTQTFHLQPWPCHLTRKVADIAVTCDEIGTCHPLVLLQGQPSEVVDCATNNEAPLTLLQASTNVERMAAWNSTRILTVEGKDVV